MVILMDLEAEGARETGRYVDVDVHAAGSERGPLLNDGLLSRALSCYPWVMAFAFAGVDGMVRTASGLTELAPPGSALRWRDTWT